MPFACGHIRMSSACTSISKKIVHEGHEGTRRKQLVHESLPVEAAFVAKVDDDANPQAGCFQIVEHLGFFFAADLSHSLELNKHGSIANEVCVILFVQASAFVVDA